MTTLPVREMVLYKHGVGFFSREGAANGDSLTLTFRQDEINDVLKSLAVFDRAGGQVLGIHYATPMDIEARLANTSIHLSSITSLRDLVRDLRGRQVELTVEVTRGSQETLGGRVIGIDEAGKETDEFVQRALLTLLEDGGQVRVLRLDALRALRILDAQAGDDLRYFLDTSVGDDNRRSVHIRLSEGEHDLAVFYVAPSPTWRVSYRLVAESDAGRATGKALLQGWGLFDNRLEEDLENVRVSLVAGQPISFIYDLYKSSVPERPVVEDEARVAPGLIAFTAAKSGKKSFPPLEDIDFDDVQRMVLPVAKSSQPNENESLDTLATSFLPDVETKDTGEFFKYSVGTPVSVKRGDSALVPIINASIAYHRELLFNEGKLLDHPIVTLRFSNTTGLTLERGPVTVIEDGDYKGEAVIDFTRNENELYVPYAVELGVHITFKKHYNRQARGFAIEDALLVLEKYHVIMKDYFLENKTPQTQIVAIEAKIRDKYELVDTRQPDMQNETLRRWHIEVPAQSRTTFTTIERTPESRTHDLRKLKYETLRKFLEERSLDQSTFDELALMLDVIATIGKAKERRTALESDRNAIYAQQEQLRANMAALQPTGQEATLRQRVLTKFEESQSQLDTLETEDAALKQHILTAEAQVEQIIANLAHKTARE